MIFIGINIFNVAYRLKNVVSPMDDFVALGSMDATVSTFYCSFYKVKTTRYKNGMEAIFISGVRASPKFCYFLLFYIQNNVL